MQAIRVCVVVIILGVGVFSTSQNMPSEKDVIRDAFKRSVGRIFDQNQLEDWCSKPHSLEQTVFANRKIDELFQCISTTVDVVFERLDDNITKSDLQDLSKGYKIFPHMCGIFGDSFKCALDFEPIFDVCLEPNEKQTQQNLFTLAPLIHRTVCLQNGAIISELAKNANNVNCAYIIYDWLMANGLPELMLSNSNVLFGSETECSEFKRIHDEAITQLFECTDDVDDLFKQVIGNFCRETKCQQFVSDLHCLV